MVALLLQFLPYIIGLIGAGALALKIRQSGVNSERSKQAAKDLAAATEGQKIDDAVAGRTADDNRGRLGEWSKS